MRPQRPAALLLLLAATAIPAAFAAPADPNRAFDREFGDRFFKSYWPLHTDNAVTVGYYQVAGQLNVPDAKERGAQLSYIGLQLAHLDRYKPDRLDAAHRGDQTLLRNELESERWHLQELRDWQWDPSQYNVANSFALLLNTEYAPLDQRLRTVLQRLERVPAYYAAAKRNVLDPSREHTQLAIQQNQGALDVFGADLDQQLAGSGLKPAEKALFAKRLDAARGAIKDYIAWLQALDAQLAQSGKARSFRLGKGPYEKKFAYDIQSGGTAEALYERARLEKERLISRMDGIAEQLWPKYMGDAAKPADRFDKIGQLIAKMSEHHVPRDRFVDTVKAMVPQLEQWVTDHRLVDLDPSKPLQVRTTPTYEQGVSIASIDAPGPYDPSARTYFNVTPLDSYTPERAESFLREYNDWVLPVLIIHEAIPGHYVQLIYANRSPSRIKSIFGNGAMIEGWAVYSERMMMESGYGGGTPESWLMYSKWNLRSVTNTILDYSVHVLGMSRDDAIRLLTHEAFQSQEEATAKWRRAQLSSVQLTSYFAGYSEIYDFRERLKQQQGAAFDLKQFHERFLGYGSAPVRLIEELMQEGK
ncbi:MAG TPA: DUF885 domain-containing protein [Nevskia sp.]|nr:DUF885 domain-containing protein [Nevskia sp.]